LHRAESKVVIEIVIEWRGFASKGPEPDGMERLRGLIRGKSAMSLNIGEYVISSRGGYYSNR
jgi:hypothetical protein